jgi:hypothetical protein
MSMALIRPTRAVAWELRAAWATGRRVALTLERADVPRLEGIVSAVAATDASARVAGLRVPLDRVLAVHLPSRLGDSTVRSGPFHGAGRLPTRPGQEAML